MIAWRDQAKPEDSRLNPNNSPDQLETSDSLLISVIIPALNEAAMIGRCLEALAQSNYSKTRFEVTVMDNGSTDRTVEIVQSYCGRLDVKVLQRPGVTVSALRNMGAALANGSILAFLDADCLVPSDWLENVERHLARMPAGIVGGYITIPDDSSWIARAWYRLGYAPQSGDVSYVPSGNLIVRRSCFIELRGFSNDLQTAEDFDLCLRARRAGWPVRGVADMAVLHLRTPQTLREFYIRERWHGAHVVLALSKNIGGWSDFRALAFAVYMLVCSIGVVGGLVSELVLRRYTLLLTTLSAMLTGAIVLSLLKLRRVRHWDVAWWALPQLVVLHIVYGMARARALISAQAIYPRSGTSRLKEDTSWYL